MENRRLKVLCHGRKGLLLPEVPPNIQALIDLLTHYFKAPDSALQITFFDTDGDECMIADETTYQAALSEFSSKVTLRLRVQNTPRNLSSDELNLEGMNYITFFKKRTRMMGIFDIDNEKLHWIKFPEGIVFKEYAAWLTLPNGSIFYSGGGHPLPSGENFLINPQTRSVRKLPNMFIPRHSHALAYSDGSVYAFGGYHSIFIFGAILSKTERFILEEEVWEETQEMECARADVGAVVADDKIFLLGKGSNYATQYNSVENARIDLKEDEGGCAAFANQHLYVFQGAKAKVCDLNDNQVIQEIALPKKSSWWSHCPPVVCKNKIYFLWWEEPEYICSFDINTNEFKTVLKF